MIPRSVEELRLNGDKMYGNPESWDIEIIQAIPRNLKRMAGFPSSTISLSVAQVLPRSLTRLDHVPVAPEAVPYIPERLTEVEIGVPAEEMG
jgi:hypothetical protein